MEYFKATDACSVCKGVCCKRMACHYAPEDFKEISFDALKAEIEKGKISIDWWEGNKREYYLRARHIGEPIVYGSWGGTCINLTETGCSLSWDERPSGGKSLNPPKHYPDRDCIQTYTTEQCKNDWKKYEDVLFRLAYYFEFEKEG